MSWQKIVVLHSFTVYFKRAALAWGEAASMFCRNVWVIIVHNLVESIVPE